MILAAFFALRLTAIVPRPWDFYFDVFLRKFACGLGFAGGRRRQTTTDGRDGRTDSGRRRRRTTTDGRDGRTEDDDDGRRRRTDAK